MIKKIVVSMLGMMSCLQGVPAIASFDSGGCDFWDTYCPLVAYPFYVPQNDTRTTLILLSSDKRHLTVNYSLPQTGGDIRRTISTPFSINRVTLMLDNVVDPKQQLGELTNKLGMTIAFPEQLDTWQDGRFVSNNSSTLSEFWQALSEDEQLTDKERSRLAYERWRIFAQGNNITTEAASLSAVVLSDSDTVDNETTATEAVVDTGSAEAEGSVFSPPAAVAVGSHAAQFADYLIAAEAFYSGQFETAENLFKTLAAASQPWIAETSNYMLIRVALNQAAVNAFDQYGFFDATKIDPEQLQQAEQSIDAYLKKYPSGMYEYSAEGLRRRISWYKGDNQQLSGYLEQTLLGKDSDSDNLVMQMSILEDYVNEIDYKLLNSYPPSAGTWRSDLAQAPNLLFTQILRCFRGHAYPTEDRAGCEITENDLIEFKTLFDKNGMKDEWHYLQAARLFYQQKAFAETEALIKTLGTAQDRSVTRFSMQILYGLSLHQQKKWPEAEKHWRELLSKKPAEIEQRFLQLMLANMLVISGQVEQVFAPDSPVMDLGIRSMLLKGIASAKLLRQQVKKGISPEEQTIALFTLLRKDLSVGNYKDYLQDLGFKRFIAGELKNPEAFESMKLAVFSWDGSQTEKGYACGSLNETAQTLVKSPKDARALNCMGEFFRTTGIFYSTSLIRETRYWDDGIYAQNVTLWDAEKLPHYFSGGERSRLKLYQQVITDKKAPIEDRSYALYRAIMCYAPSGYNQCDNQDLNVSVRKAWFNEIKKEYAGTAWEQKLKYYW